MTQTQMTADQAFQHAMGLHRAGRYAQAAQIYQRLLQVQPNHPVLLHMAADLTVRTGRPQEAEALYSRALQANPGFVPAMCGLATVYASTARLPKGVELAEQAVKAAPESHETHACLGMLLHRARRFEEADAEIQRALALLPTRADAYEQMGLMLTEIERYSQALECFEKARAMAPGAVEPVLRLGAALERSRDHARALKTFEDAAGLAPGQVHAHLGVMRILERLGEDDLALEAAERALALVPGEPLAVVTKARILRQRQQLAEARDLLHAEVARSGRSAPERGMLQIELGHVLDALGEFDSAFAHVAQGQANWAKSPRAQRHPPERFMDWVTRGPKWITREIAAEWPKDVPDGGEVDPIFFLGFPRSGTTLTEQMLAAHPALTTTDELPLVREVMEEIRLRQMPGVEYPQYLPMLTGEHIAAGRRAYWRAARQRLGAQALAGKILVDKIPLNTWRLMVIRRVFPKAKILFALRDPRDIVVSCFFQRFNPNPAMVHFQTLEGTARIYAAVMDGWLKYREYLDLDFMETRYEDLVADTEGQARKMISFLGLPWEDSVLRYREKPSERVLSTPSYMAVREPIYNKSVARWKRYEKHLGPVLPILEPYVRALGYEV